MTMIEKGILMSEGYYELREAYSVKKETKRTKSHILHTIKQDIDRYLTTVFYTLSE